MHGQRPLALTTDPGTVGIVDDSCLFRRPFFTCFVGGANRLGHPSWS